MILLAIALLALILALQSLSRRWALSGLEADHRPSKFLVEAGEEFELVLTFTNRSRLPISFLRYKETLPEGLLPAEGCPHADTDPRGMPCVSGTAWLAPRQSLERRIPVRAGRRGRYTLRPLEVRGGDFLGLKETSRLCVSFAEVVVYPKGAGEDRGEEVLGGLTGDVSVRRYLFEDPILTVGCRDYTGREPMRAISWTQSAKTGKLLVRQQDYTAEPSVSVAVSVSGGDEAGREQCLALARQVCEELEQRGVKYEFRLNAVSVGGLSPWCRVNDGGGRSHLNNVLEGLGRAQTTPALSLDKLVRLSLKDLDGARGLILILPEPIPLSAIRRRVEGRGGTLRTIVAKEVLP